MFGYIIPNYDELKVKEFKHYHEFYCGLCQSLKKNAGLRGQISLTYDMTFLGLLLSSLYEDNPAGVSHILKKSIVMSYQNILIMRLI